MHGSCTRASTPFAHVPHHDTPNCRFFHVSVYTKDIGWRAGGTVCWRNYSMHRMERHIGDNVPVRRLLYAPLVFHQMWSCFLEIANPLPCSRWYNDRNWWFRLWATGASFGISNANMIHQEIHMSYLKRHLPCSHLYILCWPYMRQQLSNEFLLCNTCISPHLSREWLPSHLVFLSYRESYPRSSWWHFWNAQYRCKTMSVDNLMLQSAHSVEVYSLFIVIAHVY